LVWVIPLLVKYSWNVMAHGDTREGKWRGNWRMEWVASTLLTTSEHGVSSITTADAHTSAANSRLNWRPHRFKWTRPFRRKTRSGFCACAITFQTQSNIGRPYFGSDRSQWPRDLGRRSTAARLLRLWVRILQGSWMSVCCTYASTELCRGNRVSVNLSVCSCLSLRLSAYFKSRFTGPIVLKFYITKYQIFTKIALIELCFL
jgi:hypothetical protein